METSIKLQIVINNCYGGYSLSEKAERALAARKGLTLQERGGYLYVADTRHSLTDIVPRHDPDLVAVVRELGKEADGDCAELKIVEVELAVEIDSYDGRESVHVHGRGE